MEQRSRHITIVGGTIIKNILDKLSQKEKSQMIHRIRKLLKSFDWQFIPTDIYRISRRGLAYDDFEKDERESYIRVIKMRDMIKFYKKLNHLLKTNFPTQFPHITLFTRGDRPDAPYRGIAINSKEKFKQLYPKKVK